MTSKSSNGRIRFPGWAPVVPSRHGSRYAYGHITEQGRQMVVSGGLGCSGFPRRFGMPPKITLVEIGG